MTHLEQSHQEPFRSLDNIIQTSQRIQEQRGKKWKLSVDFVPYEEKYREPNVNAVTQTT